MYTLHYIKSNLVLLLKHYCKYKFRFIPRRDIETYNNFLGWMDAAFMVNWSLRTLEYYSLETHYELQLCAFVKFIVFSNTSEPINYHVESLNGRKGGKLFWHFSGVRCSDASARTKHPSN